MGFRIQMRYIWNMAQKRATAKKVGIMVIGEEIAILFCQHLVISIKLCPCCIIIIFFFFYSFSFWCSFFLLQIFFFRNSLCWLCYFWTNLSKSVYSTVLLETNWKWWKASLFCCVWFTSTRDPNKTGMSSLLHP